MEFSPYSKYMTIEWLAKNVKGCSNYYTLNRQMLWEKYKSKLFFRVGVCIVIFLGGIFGILIIRFVVPVLSAFFCCDLQTLKEYFELLDLLFFGVFYWLLVLYGFYSFFKAVKEPVEELINILFRS